MDGVINLDKPAGISSARAVDRVKRLLPRDPRPRIGHAGTLDPFATGVLLLLIGRGTKSCEALMGAPKQYLAAVKFGATTATDDPESPERPWAPRAGSALTPPTRETVERVLGRFVGAIQQRPPAFSAMKLQGRRAYDLARKGHDVALEPRTVHVYGIELLRYDWPVAEIRIDCGRGTYIRSIARDLGEAIDVGAHLTALRRTRIGPFSVESAVSAERLGAEGIPAHLLPVPRS